MLRNWTNFLATGRRSVLAAATAMIAVLAVVAGCGDESQQTLENNGLHVQDLTVGTGDVAAPGD